MHTEIVNKIVDVCNILNSHNVKYLIVGGTAVAFHGYFRWSVDGAGIASEKFDIDFWYDPSYDNYFHLLNALNDMGHDVTAFKNEKTPNPKSSFFKLEIENFTIDFLPTLKISNKFSSAYKNKDVVELNNVQLFFIGIDDLIADKAANNRPKDLEDIKHLNRIKKEN